MQRDAVRAHLRRADEERPEQEIRQEHPDDDGTEPPHDAFEERLARRELPAREAFGDDELHERADRDRPEHGRAEHAADEARGRQVAPPTPVAASNRPGPSTAETKLGHADGIRHSVERPRRAEIAGDCRFQEVAVATRHHRRRQSHFRRWQSPRIYRHDCYQRARLGRKSRMGTGGVVVTQRRATGGESASSRRGRRR